MANLLNSARMTTATTGTGTVTLGSAVTGFFTFADAGAVNATLYSYTIEDGNDVEHGRGTYTSSGTTFSRDTVLKSLISGVAGTTKLTLSGTAQIFIAMLAEDIPGEYIESTVALASAVTLTTGTRTDITSISLTPGDWDVEGNVEMANVDNPTVSTLLAFVNDVSATNPTGLGTEGGFVQWRGSTTSNVGTCTGNRRFNIATTTTIYLTCNSTFTGGTSAKAYGLIRARRYR